MKFLEEGRIPRGTVKGTPGTLYIWASLIESGCDESFSWKKNSDKIPSGIPGKIAAWIAVYSVGIM